MQDAPESMQNNEEKKPIPFPYGEIFTCRVLLFIESAPQSNTYNQIRLTPQQFRDITAAIYLAHGGRPGGRTAVMFHTGDNNLKFPERLCDFYDQPSH